MKGLSHTSPDGLSGFGDYCRPIQPACRNKLKQPIPCPKQNVCDKRNNMLYHPTAHGLLFLKIIHSFLYFVLLYKDDLRRKKGEKKILKNVKISSFFHFTQFPSILCNLSIAIVICVLTVLAVMPNFFAIS